MPGSAMSDFDRLSGPAARTQDALRTSPPPPSLHRCLMGGAPDEAGVELLMDWLALRPKDER
ncbi:hypothetical protein [Palleronia abyssalis]|uniref:Uncharacterized protein n=1 Tax=Palleronia abyssalis TaxID=1501240 RepID=A0A2R8BYC2_9RHOB|nr:hypothetical protein [Palleronia abyssalis]SPJ25132.1 hypothetical protein PAA8504_02978 [Palleronia abyssalis]